MRSIYFLWIFSPLCSFAEQSIVSYTDLLINHCSPPFHYYKSWCYYLVPNLSLDWFSANRYCRSIDSQTSLLFIKDSDEMIDPLRDILIHRENFPFNQSLWTNTSWGDQRRTILSRQSKRLCRKLQLKSRTKTGQIDQFRMPFGNCREKHRFICRKELPSNVFCPRPWAFAYGFCYYLDEHVRIVSNEEEERNDLQCRAWQGELFFSSKTEQSILPPFLFFSLHALQSSEILRENFGGISYQLSNLIDQPCSIVSGDVFLSVAMKSLKNSSSCSSFRSHTFCRRRYNSTCSPPWFADDGFCLYFAPNRTFDRAAAAAECFHQGGSLLYISNEEELFRLTHNLQIFSRFFPSLSLAGVWLAVSRRAPYAQTPIEFEWLWDYSIQSNLDFHWRTIDWQRYFQWRLSPDLVSAGECAALILDRQIREPIERTSCDYPRTVICRKPFDDQRILSFHQKDRYKKLSNVANILENLPKKISSNDSLSILTIERTLFEQYNSSFYRWIVHLNGSSSMKRRFVFICQSKGILHEEIFSTTNSVIKFDQMIKSDRSEYEIIFEYLRSNECFSNRINHSCLYVLCQSNDQWSYLLPEIVSRWNSTRSSFQLNERCSKRTNYSTSDRILCTILLEQFQFSEEPIRTILTTKKNRCEDFNGQCLPETETFSFADPFLNCSKGFRCVFLGERCHSNGFCLDRLRFPCPIVSQLSNTTCSNSHYDCCLSSSSSTTRSSLIVSTTTTKPSIWDIFLPLFYFSFNTISKWDRLFFDRWMKMDNDLSEDFINDEFVYSCHGIFLDSNLLLTHQSCRPVSSILSDDKRSILFSLMKKSHFDPFDDDQYDRVALHLDSYQIYSPFQLIRLAYQPDFLVNKTFKRLNQNSLSDDQLSTLHCLLIQYENPIRSIRLLNNFQRQIFFDNTNAVFLLENDDETDELTWLFAPVVCLLPEENYEWIIVGISGQQLNHRCLIDHQKKFCQMTPIVASTWI